MRGSCLLLLAVVCLVSACSSDPTAPKFAPTTVRPQFTTAYKLCPVYDPAGQLIIWYVPDDQPCPNSHPGGGTGDGGHA